MLDRSPNRARFLLEALHDLDRSLAVRGAQLVIRSGDPATVAASVAARHRCDEVFLTEDGTHILIDAMWGGY